MNEFQIYNEDCLQGMKKIPSGSVDFILADLPYGITSAPFDKRLPFEPLWQEFWRVVKPNAAIALFAVGKFNIELAASQLNFYRYEWIYQKACASGYLNCAKMPMRIHENVLVFYKKLPTYNPQFGYSDRKYHAANRRPSKNWNAKVTAETINNGRRYPVDVLYFVNPVTGNREGAATTFHCQQKPVDLLEYLIKTYSNEGETVLDCTMGSGSTGVACMNVSRRFIGFELDEGFFKTAEKRITEALAKKRQELF